MNLAQFKTFVISLINSIISKGDDRAAKDAATIAKISADAAALAATVAELKAALAASQDAGTAALAAKTSEQASALDALTTELQNTFNPTPVADAVAEVVAEAPEVETPSVVAKAPEFGTVTPTPPVVVEAAVEAIGNVFVVPELS
jgi:predicted trehalose synthase